MSLPESPFPSVTQEIDDCYAVLFGPGTGRTLRAGEGGRGDVDLPAENTQAEESGVTERREEGDTWEHPSSISRSIGGWGLTGGELPRAGTGGPRDVRTVVEAVVEPCATTCAGRKVRVGFGGGRSSRYRASLFHPRGRMVRDGNHTRERR